VNGWAAHLTPPQPVVVDKTGKFADLALPLRKEMDMQNEPTGVAIGDATLIRVHGCEPTFRLDGRMGALMLSGKRFGFALRVLIQHGFVVLI
jgi:hypothetical protein